jgi:hypothetical protein
MEQKPDKLPEDSHDRPPQDEVTKNKIDKHLSDIDDTISEEDIKKINTNIGIDGTAQARENEHDIDEADEIMKDNPGEEADPEKEAPSSWEILGE